jgi:hypothetical protein
MTGLCLVLFTNRRVSTTLCQHTPQPLVSQVANVFKQTLALDADILLHSSLAETLRRPPQAETCLTATSTCIAAG